MYYVVYGVTVLSAWVLESDAWLYADSVRQDYKHPNAVTVTPQFGKTIRFLDDLEGSV